MKGAQHASNPQPRFPGASVTLVRCSVLAATIYVGLLWTVGCGGTSSSSPSQPTPAVPGAPPPGGSGSTTSSGSGTTSGTSSGSASTGSGTGTSSGGTSSGSTSGGSGSSSTGSGTGETTTGSGSGSGSGSGTTSGSGGSSGSSTGGSSGSTTGGGTTTGSGGSAPPGFTQQTYTNVGSNQLLAADLTGDSKADLVFHSARLSVMLNDGSGHFSPPSPLSMPSGLDFTAHIALSDFNNDGFRDIAACEFSSSSSSAALVIYLNNRSGQFNITQSISVPGCMGLGAGDANRDGKVDVALGYFTPPSTAPQNTIVTYFGDGSGHFNSSATQSNFSLDQQHQGFPNPCYLAGIGGADFDGEGTLDLLVFATCQQGSTATQGSVYFARGDGTGHYLLTEIAEGAGTISRGPEIKDTNRDGMLDFGYVKALDGPHASTVSTLRLGVNGGAGIFRMTDAHQESSYAGDGTHLNAGSFSDVTGDGIYDAVVGFSSFWDCCPPPGPLQGIIIKTGQPDGTFKETQRWGTDEVPQSIATADFDGNGTQDIAVITNDPNSGKEDLLVYLNKGK